MVDVAVNRLSEQADIIPLMISERLIDVHKDYSGSTVESIGQFAPTTGRYEGIKNRLMLSIFVREIQLIEEFTDLHQDPIRYSWTAISASPPIYRKTPLGREIAEIFFWL